MELRKGKYTFKIFQFNKPPLQNTVDVEILKETERSYLVRLKGFTCNRIPNEEIWVSKKFVKVTSKPNNDSNSVKEFWWNKD